ncbi:MAG TPA: FKBP-type peptidyl-prolyl cis-trans isomerase [Steroidobacteraceae bacterium]|jgi:FKBP-type peptidyl-prolyl cis-trans isomerase|nr:FKBP-type peptidyl-prolyl cis-trans isomerase [Steroidobacteraceae bacterium]
MPMRRIVSLLCLGLLGSAAACGFALAADEAPPSHAHHAAAAGAADSDSAQMHALGLLLSRPLGQQLDPFQLSDRELRAVLAGISDGIRHPDSVKAAEAFVPQLQAMQQQRGQAQVQVEEKIGAAYLSKAAAQPHARTTSSGLVFIPEQPGSGPSPKIGDQVRVEYTGRLTDGSVFDSSATHGGAATFPLGHIIPCWNEGLALMKVGGSARLVCPAKLAYGERGAGGVIKPGATLDFEVHLVGIAPPAPAAAAGPPRVAPAVPTH